MTINQLIDEIIEREGGSTYTNDPTDAGGATKFGITRKTLQQWRGAATDLDVEHLGRDEAEKIYRAMYVKTPRFDMIENDALRGLVVDAGVNHGVTRASKWLQEVVGVVVDGKVGAITLEAVNGGFPESIFRRFLARRIQFYGEIVSRNPSQVKYIRGWLNRATEFLA